MSIANKGKLINHSQHQLAEIGRQKVKFTDTK